jgi:alkylhydroperoxidase family enzyme
MHTNTPRIAPISPDDFTPEQSKLARVGTGRENLNLVRTMVNHPGVYDRFISFAEELVFNSHLTVRDREILILKTLVLCRGEYEAPIHEAVAKKLGFSSAEVAAARGDGAGLPAGERALVRAADELIRDHFVSDAT